MKLTQTPKSLWFRTVALAVAFSLPWTEVSAYAEPLLAPAPLPLLSIHSADIAIPKEHGDQLAVGLVTVGKRQPGRYRNRTGHNGRASHHPVFRGAQVHGAALAAQRA